MIFIPNQDAAEMPAKVIITDQYVDVNENIQEVSYVDPETNEPKTRIRFDVKRYGKDEYLKIVAEENEELKVEVAEIRDALLEQIDEAIGG